MRQMLFKTVHGSRLYGLHHAGSDEDFYTVYTKVPTLGKQVKSKYSKQTIVDGVDTMALDLGTWLGQCQMGVPQALEAMFSELPIMDDISHLRRSYRATGAEVQARYLRTIKSFCLAEEFKKKRHGLRLALNLQELMRTGRFNPTLSPVDIEFVSDYARKGNDDVYGLALCIAYDIG